MKFGPDFVEPIPNVIVLRVWDSMLASEKFVHYINQLLTCAMHRKIIDYEKKLTMNEKFKLSLMQCC